MHKFLSTCSNFFSSSSIFLILSVYIQAWKKKEISVNKSNFTVIYNKSTKQFKLLKTFNPEVYLKKKNNKNSKYIFSKEMLKPTKLNKKVKKIEFICREKWKS